MPAIITPERPDTADARALIDELEAHLSPLYPQESRHGYAVEKLISEDVKVGTGPAAEVGDTVVMEYRGTLAASGSTR